MARRLHRTELPCIAASAINQSAVVGLAAGATESAGLSQNLSVIPLATSNVFPIGIALATAAIPTTGVGNAVTVLDETNVAVVTAIGSTGHGARVGVASTNGGIAPVAGASGSLVYQVGFAVSNALAGEALSVYIKPEALSGKV